ncbi:MAG: cell division protein FtsL [Candidatus Limosilactobacillus merdavium]|uniref:Cell division protein FtsL n=1 Tax=Candidatus Limosilactobacillus merdavium TaxID=2838651 RepID=A0A9E2KUE7_9LACO|nr:cell division protein FtsL [Candidatus Limosilactobacillus merdavium]
MVSNTAKRISRDQPRTTDPGAQVHQQLGPSVKTVTWSTFERGLVTACSILTLCLTISLLSTKNTINSRQHQLQDLQTKVYQAKNDNASHRQAIADMTSQSQLRSAAKKYGLVDHNSNVRNVNK